MSSNKKKQQELVASYEKKIEDVLKKGHKMPKTRREFLAHGFIGGASTVMLPSFVTMLAGQNDVFAQTAACELPQFSAGLPYICLDVGGGMNIAGQNAIVGMANSDYQEDVGGNSDYIRLGITQSEAPSGTGRMVDTYGLKFHRTSGILEGLNTVLTDPNAATPGDLFTMPNGRPISDGIDGLVFCTRTSDDTATNQINSVYMANKAGAKGELVQLIGNNATDTGARSAAPGGEINLNLRPSNVRSNNDAEGLLSLGGVLSSNNYLNATGSGGQDRIKSFMDRVSRMSKSKVNELSKKGSIDQIRDVLNCSADGAKQLFDTYSAAMLNPGNDASVTNVFGGQSERVASVAKLVLDSIAGAGTITIGGGDYHGGTAVNTHAKDVEVGMAIGRCIRLAMEKGKNLAIHLYTDGGVAGDAGGVSEPVNVLGVGQVEKIRWVGDSGTRSAALLLVYKHNHDGSSLVREGSAGPRRQVGNFVKNGGVNLTTVVGNSTENLWKAIMLNYLAAQGREGEFENVFGRATLPPNYQSLIRMKKIT